MKTLCLIRHAKSDWDHPELDDLHRPLNDRGLHDAPFMANMLKARGVQADAIVSSPAARAMATALFFKSALDIKDSNVLVRDAIYDAMPATILQLVRSLSDEFKEVLLFGHNPTLNSVINMFSEEYVSNLPTCGVFIVQAEIGSWADFNQKMNYSCNLYYPRLYS
jgi:phosphohistidine phosphatase